MNEKLMEFFKKKNNIIIIIILLIGTLLMVLPSPKKKTESLEQYSDDERLREIISQIKGVRDVSVMVTFTGTVENNLAFEIQSNTYQKGQDGFEETVDKKVIMSDDGPFISSKSYPKVKGVVVIAKGANDAKTKADILDAVMTAYDIAPHKVCILSK